MINDLPTVFEVVNGKKVGKPSSSTNGSNKSKPNSKVVRENLLNACHSLYSYYFFHAVNVLCAFYFSLFLSLVFLQFGNKCCKWSPLF